MAVRIPAPRNTEFMMKLVDLIAAHSKAISKPGYTTKNPIRVRLRRHIASATKEDVRDMVRRRYHEFGDDSEKDYQDATEEIQDVVKACRREFSGT